MGITRTEFIEAYAARSGLEAKYAKLGILDIGDRHIMIALPCACDNDCEGWAMCSVEGVLPQLEMYAPEVLTTAYRDAVTAQGGI